MFSVQIAVIILACVLFFGRIFFGFFKRFSPFDSATPINLETTPKTEGNGDFTNEIEDSIDETDTNQIVADEPAEEAANQSNQVNQIDTITQQPSTSHQKRRHFKQIRSKFFPSTRRKGNIPSASDLQSPFIPTLLRSCSVEMYKEKKSTKSTDASNQQSSNEEGSRPETPGSALNVSKIEIDLKDDELDLAPSRLSYGTAAANDTGSIKIENNSKTGSQNPAFQ